MLYTPGELALELGVTTAQLETYQTQGLPTYSGDPHWFHGATVAAWFAAQPKAKPKRMGEGQAYCLKCKCVVELHQPTVTRKYGVKMLVASCPHCASQVQRGVR